MSKNNILSAIRSNKPVEVTLPVIPPFPGNEAVAAETFIAMVLAGGGQVIQVSGVEEINTFIETGFPRAQQIASLVSGVNATIELGKIDSALSLERVDVAVIRGDLGVAENGAVWVPERACVHRALPFITQHLVILLSQKDIVRNMHEAYSQIKIDAEGFGVFIAGPSKTADIEQALVIGAQGARSLTIAILNGS